MFEVVNLVGSGYYFYALFSENEGIYFYWKYINKNFWKDIRFEEYKGSLLIQSILAFGCFFALVLFFILAYFLFFHLRLLWKLVKNLNNG